MKTEKNTIYDVIKDYFTSKNNEKMKQREKDNDNESFGNNTLHNISKNYVLKSALCNDSNASSNVNTSYHF